MDVRGVDFSGAADPGDDIWIADGTWNGDRLEVQRCRSAAEAFDATAREPVLEALVDSLREAPGTTGVDVSFGLPAALLPESVETWADSVEWFAEAFSDADAPEMRETLKERARTLEADGVELKRRTDEAVRANSPYSFITYYQTYYGISEVLAPLLEAGGVSVPPMGSPGEQNVVEVYPAGTLRRLETVDEQYKNGGPEGLERREEILGAVTDDAASVPVEMDEEIRGRALDDPGGDALDSVVAAVATARAVEQGFEPPTPYDEREGCIYV